MSAPFSKAMSAATAAYAVFALVKPRHLGTALTSNPAQQPSYDGLATAYGVRDLAISSIALLGRSGSVVRAAMVARICFDVTDAALLAPKAENGNKRSKVLAAALGWGALNALAVILDAVRK